MKKLALFILTALIPFSSYSDHIIGGDFSVQHVDGNTFLAVLTLYRDCNGGGAPFDPTVNITVFDNVTNDHITDLDFQFTNLNVVDAELGNSCFTPDICMEIGTYEAEFTLDNNPNGYYLSKERCCRNDLSINLLGTDLGFVFTLDVPDPVLQNSSPEFGEFPTEAFFCVNGEVQIDFGATDVDGDSLVYGFTEPLNGESTAFAPNPDVATPKPYDVVMWAPGYTTNDQVGGTNPMSINPETGLITAQPDLVGIFTIAVKVEEYRDGEKIGEIRRELQLASSVCAIDLPSVISTPDNDTVFDVLANTELCFDITATDPNEGDTLFLFAEGELFDGSVMPLATFPPADSISAVTQNFCWAPLCSNLSDEPYVITVSAFSVGCSPDTLITTQDLYFNVFVEPDEPTEYVGPAGGYIIDLYDPSTHSFNIEFEDPNEADSLTVLDIQSEIFEDGSVEPIEPITDQGQLNLPLTWNVTCDDVRDEPYFIEFNLVTTNCDVLDTTQFLVPITVIVQPNEPTEFVEPPEEIFFEFYSSDSLIIPVSVADGNYFDTLTVSAASEIFNQQGNPAIFESLTGNSFLEGDLIWIPECDDVRDEPYQVIFTATANSCKTDDVVQYPIEIFLSLPPENQGAITTPADGTFITHFIGEDPIDFTVLGTDQDSYDTLSLEIAGSILSAPVTTPVFNTTGFIENVFGDFSWTPRCGDVQDDPYDLTFVLRSRSCQKNETVEINLEILLTTPTKGKIEPIQNVMTPNGDGFNDNWTIENKDDPCLLDFKAQVFDRWGKEVYITRDPSFEWNGESLSSEELLGGTFFRTIEYTYKRSRQTYSGTVDVLK